MADRKVEHFIVQADAYNEVIRYLGTQTINAALGTLNTLTQGSQAVFERLPGDMPSPPEQGKIVDPMLSPDDEADEQPSPDEHVEFDDRPPNVVELQVDPPANDAGDPPAMCDWKHEASRTYRCKICYRVYILAPTASDSYPPDRMCTGPVETKPEESA